MRFENYCIDIERAAVEDQSLGFIFIAPPMKRKTTTKKLEVNE